MYVCICVCVCVCMYVCVCVCMYVSSPLCGINPSCTLSVINTWFVSEVTPVLQSAHKRYITRQAHC
jgi:hypothetical protein